MSKAYVLDVIQTLPKSSDMKRLQKEQTVYYRREWHFISFRCRQPIIPVFLDGLANASGH